MDAESHPGQAAEPVWPADAVEVGRVSGAWGLKGELKVKPFSADPQALFSCKRWFIAPRDDSPGRAASAAPSLLRVVRAREQGDSVVAKVQDVDDRDAAQALAGLRIFVSRASFPTPADDEFYWVDLIGLQVMNRAGEDLGQVAGLLETGPHCVLRLASSDGSERLIPFVSAYVDGVDMQARRILVDWPADY